MFKSRKNIGEDGERTIKDVIRPRGVLLILAGAILMLPHLHVIDIIPDALAYLILLYVIAPYAMLDDHMREAQRYLEHMLLISVAELASVFLIYMVLSSSPQEQPMTILLCCFVFAFFRIKTVFPLTTELTSGLEYLDVRSGCSVFSRDDTVSRKTARRNSRKNASVSDRMMRAVRIFIVATSVLNTLPEFAALSYIPGDDTVRNTYEYISLLRGFCFLISLIFGIVFFCRLIRFTRRVTADHTRTCYTQLNLCYCRENDAHPERETQRRLRKTFWLMTAFSIFTIDFMVDRVNVLPGFVAAILLLFVFLVLRQELSHFRASVWVTIGYALVSGAHFVVSTIFWQRYVPESITRSERIRAKYIPVQVLSVCEAIMLLLCMLALFRALFELIDRHTGYEIEGTVNYSREEKLHQEHAAYKKDLIPAMILGFMTVLSGPLFTFLRPTVEFAWLFSALIPAAFSVVLTMKLAHIRDGVDDRFLLK